MPKYNVGGVASLFPKPKESTTETGKKLQSLFSEFHNKGYKRFSQSPQKHLIQDKKKVEKQDTENESNSKKKKRKFSSSTDVESNVENIIKKFKKENDIEDLKSFMGTEVKEKNSSTEVDFPRRKKKGQKPNFKFDQKNSFENSDLSRNSQQSQNLSSNKTESSNVQDNKPVPNFIRKSKNLNAGRGFVHNRNENTGTGKFAKKSHHTFYSDALFEESKNQNVKNKFKKNRQENFDVTSAHDSSLNEESENQKVKKKFKKNKQVNLNGASGHDSLLNKESENKNVKKFKNPNAAGFTRNRNENAGMKKFSQKSQRTVYSDDLFEESENQVVKKFKDKHVNFNGTSDNESSSNKESENPNLKKKFKKSKHKFDDTIDNDSSLNKESENMNVKKKFKKNKQKNFNDASQNSELAQPNVNEPDFIKLPETDDKEEVLSRTLFVGNLPTNTSRKALAKLFSSFGPVEKVRYFGIETDKNKIYKHGGPKQQNLHYAAESVPGFVVFKGRQSAVDALSLSGSMFQGHHITVDFAMPAGSKKFYDEKRSIFIGNLPFGIQDEIIWNAFAEYGKIEGVRIVRDRATGIGKGFGYVLFSSVQAKENALKLEDFEIEGRIIRIKAVETGKKTSKKSKKDFRSVKRDSFKSRAIKYKKKHEDTTSRKSVKKIMKKNKDIHKKKKIASILQKSMK